MHNPTPTDGFVRLPGDDASPAEVDAFYAALGVPEAPEGYELTRPDDLDWSAPRWEQYRSAISELSHALGLSPQQAQALVDLDTQHQDGLGLSSHSMMTEVIARQAAEIARLNKGIGGYTKSVTMNFEVAEKNIKLQARVKELEGGLSDRIRYCEICEDLIAARFKDGYTPEDVARTLSKAYRNIRIGLEEALSRSEELAPDASETNAESAETGSEELSQWQPIETAPRDRPFLALEHPDGDMYRAEFNWEDEDSGVYYSSHCGQYVVERPEPTHWMPLPATPEDQTGDQLND